MSAKPPTLSHLARLRGHIMAAMTHADEGRVKELDHHLARALEMITTIEDEMIGHHDQPRISLPLERAKGVH